LGEGEVTLPGEGGGREPQFERRNAGPGQEKKRGGFPGECGSDCELKVVSLVRGRKQVSKSREKKEITTTTDDERLNSREKKKDPQ